ncbi:PREDICTED: protein lethal(2)essential for life-like [Cyphomyrmex costatus]|uniref:Protein lethal(2)essential for life n=1 Tax=Cyphomyrmex costatus TaxID=456900 RepID=A0A195CQI1_9HYME|nr:PREDICTED: protein lethal(2)essential for life-like [Cyphomyrmex costatus]KYN03003.1 Protein lethal(2)essential for life [Cyphomyrmex costatus]
MHFLPLLLSNLHLGLDVPINPVGLSAGTPSKMNFVRSRLSSRFLDHYSPNNFYGRGVLDFYSPFWKNLSRYQHVVSSTSIDNDGYKININVQQYKPEEITVKVEDNWVIIKGRHKKQDKFNVGSQQFMLRYLLPRNTDIDHITSSTSSDGIMTITIPLKPTYRKVIQIEQTRQSAVSSNNTRQVGTGQNGMEQVDVRQADAGFAGAEQTGVEQANANSASVGQTDRLGQVNMGQAGVGKADGEKLVAFDRLN